MKKCSRCGIDKEICEFQVRKASRDGLTASCKKCLSEYDKSRASDPKRVAARSDYAKSERGRAVHKKNSRDWYVMNKERSKEIKKAWQEKNEKKRRVHGVTAYAVKLGILIRSPCEVCGVVGAYAHHDDYDEPLNVRWLCQHHHSLWHAENGEGANPR